MRKAEDVLELTKLAAVLDMMEWAKRVLRMKNEAMNYVCLVKNGKYHKLERLYEVCDGQELVTPLKVLRRSYFYHLRHLSELHEQLYDLFGQNKLYWYVDLPKKFINQVNVVMSFILRYDIGIVAETEGVDKLTEILINGE